MNEFVHISDLWGTPIHHALLKCAHDGKLAEDIDNISDASGFEYKFSDNCLYLKLVDEQKYLLWSLSQ